MPSLPPEVDGLLSPPDEPDEEDSVLVSLLFSVFVSVFASLLLAEADELLRLSVL